MNQGSPNANAAVPAKAVVFSLGGSIAMLLKELIRSYGIKITSVVDNFDEMMRQLQTGEAECVVIDDAVEMPSLIVLRRMYRDPIAVLAPKLVFLGEPHPITEKDIITRLSGVPTIGKPLTPVKFHPVMRSMVAQIRNEPYTTLRAVSRALIEGRGEMASKVLTKLLPTPAIGDWAGHALVAYLMNVGDIKSAEKLLLALVKRNPRSAITLFQLIDLYYSAAMPKHGLRVASGLKQACPTSIAVLPDLINGYMLQQDFVAAGKFLHELHTAGSMIPVARDYLFRILTADGRVEEAARYLVHAREREEVPALIDKAWADPVEVQPAAAPR